MKPVKMIDIGTKAKSLFLPSPSELQEKEEVPWKDCLNCVRLTTEDLQKKLPLDSFFWNCSYIQLQKKDDKNTLESIIGIAQDITKALLQVLVNVFSKNTSPEEVCDASRSKWRLYQMEEIKEEHCCCTTVVVLGWKQVSY